MAITITHPGARLLAPALDTLADVVAGDWASAARLCAARLRDPDACERDLDVAAARAGATRSDRQPYRYQVHHWMLVVNEHPAVLAAALDLQMKLRMGQWDALEQVTPAGRGSRLRAGVLTSCSRSGSAISVTTHGQGGPTRARACSWRRRQRGWRTTS